MKTICRSLVLMSLAFVSLAATLTVNNQPFIPSCPAQYATIQAAVNAAAPGDTV